MNLFELTVPQLAKTLRTLDRWLKLAEQNAETRKFPVDNLIQTRLAPDQFPLVKQIQTACDNAKFIPGRLSAKDWPSHADTETTFEQLTRGSQQCSRTSTRSSQKTSQARRSVRFPFRGCRASG